MAVPKSTLPRTTYSFNGGSINLRASMRALSAIRLECGSDPISYVVETFQNTFQNLSSDADSNTVDMDGFMSRVAGLLFHLQDEPDHVERDDIYEWLLSGFTSFWQQDNLIAIWAVTQEVMGLEVAERVREASASGNEPVVAEEPKRKLASSTASKSRSAT